MTVAEMLDRMSSSELARWKAFYELEPFGDLRADLRMGMGTAPLVNLLSGKGARTAKASDWIMDFDPQDLQSAEAMKQILMGLAKAMDKSHTSKPKRRRTRKK